MLIRPAILSNLFNGAMMNHNPIISFFRPQASDDARASSAAANGHRRSASTAGGDERVRAEQAASLLTEQEKNDGFEMDVEPGPGEREEDTQKHSGMGVEYSVAPTVKFAWLGTYFFFSLMLTLYNKFVLGKFHFPWLLTTLHATFASAGTYAMNQSGQFKLSRLGRREHLALAAFSALFTANIAVSNLSLNMVSVPFYQTMRMLCPLFTILIFRVWYSRIYSNMTYLSLLPIILGAGMTTVGELSFTDAGFILTILGVVLAAVKTVVTNRFMTGSLALPPLEFLMRMSPLAAIQAFACASATGEVSAFYSLVRSGEVRLIPDGLSLFGNGFLAFLLNISSFQTNKLAGALTMTVCGNLKQCLTVALGIVLFDVRVDFMNGVGMAITMLGAAIYSKSELDSKRAKQNAAYKPVPQDAENQQQRAV